jgi:hypothetical protein
MPRRHRPPTTEPSRLILRGEADRMLMRKIVNFFGVWAWCYRSCRRHKGCASPTVKCFDHNIETARKILQQLADWPRLDGPRELDDLVEPVEDLFD